MGGIPAMVHPVHTHHGRHTHRYTPGYIPPGRLYHRCKPGYIPPGRLHTLVTHPGIYHQGGYTTVTHPRVYHHGRLPTVTHPGYTPLLHTQVYTTVGTSGIPQGVHIGWYTSGCAHRRVYPRWCISRVIPPGVVIPGLYLWVLIRRL